MIAASWKRNQWKSRNIKREIGYSGSPGIPRYNKKSKSIKEHSGLANAAVLKVRCEQQRLYDTVSPGREMTHIWLTIDNGSSKRPFWRSFRRGLYKLGLIYWDWLSSCILRAYFKPLFGIANRRGRNSKMHYVGYLWIIKWRVKTFCVIILSG